MRGEAIKYHRGEIIKQFLSDDYRASHTLFDQSKPLGKRLNV